jgi:hypothetical protein
MCRCLEAIYFIHTDVLPRNIGHSFGFSAQSKVTPQLLIMAFQIEVRASWSRKDHEAA